MDQMKFVDERPVRELVQRYVVRVMLVYVLFDESAFAVDVLRLVYRRNARFQVGMTHDVQQQNVHYVLRHDLIIRPLVHELLVEFLQIIIRLIVMVEKMEYRGRQVAFALFVLHQQIESDVVHADNHIFQRRVRARIFRVHDVRADDHKIATRNGVDLFVQQKSPRPSRDEHDFRKGMIVRGGVPVGFEFRGRKI